MSRDSGLDDPMIGVGNFSLHHRVQNGSRANPTSYPTPGALSLGIKWPGREADHSPPSSAEVKECVELYFHSPNTSSCHGTWLCTGNNDRQGKSELFGKSPAPAPLCHKSHMTCPWIEVEPRTWEVGVQSPVLFHGLLYKSENLWVLTHAHS
jgi:hypothetical protein